MIILVNNQLDSQFFFICLFQFSTCFEQPRAHHRENQLYQYTIWYVSHCVDDRLVYRSGSSFLTCTLDGRVHMYWYNWFSWWWARGCSKHVENWSKHIEKELCVRLVVYKKYIEMAARSTEHKMQQMISQHNHIWSDPHYMFRVSRAIIRCKQIWNLEANTNHIISFQYQYFWVPTLHNNCDSTVVIWLIYLYTVLL
jgi:hypothetical protein